MWGKEGSWWHKKNKLKKQFQGNKVWTKLSKLNNELSYLKFMPWYKLEEVNYIFSVCHFNETDNVLMSAENTIEIQNNLIQRTISIFPLEEEVEKFQYRKLFMLKLQLSEYNK